MKHKPAIAIGLGVVIPLLLGTHGSMAKKPKPIGPFLGKMYLAGLIDFREQMKEIGKGKEYYQSELLAEVLFAMHPRFIGKRRPRSSIFRYHNPQERLGNAIYMDSEWITFSFNDIGRKKPPNWKAIVKNQLSERWLIRWREEFLSSGYFEQLNHCSICNTRRPYEIDHIHPSHKTIKAFAMIPLQNDLITQEAIQKEWLKIHRNYDPFLCQVFRRYDWETIHGSYQYICKPCHAKVTKMRRAQGII